MNDAIAQFREELSKYLAGGSELQTTERTISVVAGLLLAASATKPRPNMFLNVLALAGGSYLAYRGAVGHCPLKGMLAESSSENLPEMDARTAGIV